MKITTIHSSKKDKDYLCIMDSNNKVITFDRNFISLICHVFSIDIPTEGDINIPIPCIADYFA